MASRSDSCTSAHTMKTTLTGQRLSSENGDNILSLPNQCLTSDPDQNNISHTNRSPSGGCEQNRSLTAHYVQNGGEQNSLTPNQVTPSQDDQNTSSLTNQCESSSCEQTTLSFADLNPTSGDEPITAQLTDQCTPCVGQRLNNSTDSTDECWHFDNESCYICNGHYGPSSKGEVCSTCHSFLYPPNGLPSSYFGSYWPHLAFNRARACEILANEERRDPAGDDSEREEPIFNLDGGVSEREDPAFHLQGDDSEREDPTVHDDGCGLEKEDPTVHDDGCGLDKEDPVKSNGNELTRRNSSLSSLDESKYCIAELLPPEILLEIFSKLDDHSLWNAGDVCLRWKQVSRSRLADDLWRTHTKHRWPLFKTDQPIHSWCFVYNWLLESCSCKSCLFLVDQPVEAERGIIEFYTIRRSRLAKERLMLRREPHEGIDALPLDKHLRRWTATIAGPVGSPFEGGTFHLSLQVPANYPFEPPTVRFATKIFHPNVSRHGDIGVDCILFDWNAAQNIGSLLISIQSLLTDPFCQVCMEPEVGRMYLDDRQRYEAIALDWTRKYATYLPAFADIPEIPEHLHHKI